MENPPTKLEFHREEGVVQVTFTPGLTIDQWGQTAVLRQPLSRAEFEQAARVMGDAWGVKVEIVG